MAISQRFRVFVFLAMLQSHDLSNGSDFSILHDHLMSRFADIEKFSTKREHCNLERTLRQSVPPYKSRPTIPKPAVVRAFAESPSVRIKVQRHPSLVPALFASSNFMNPVNLARLLPPDFANCCSALNLAKVRTLSTTPLFKTTLSTHF